MSGPGHYVAYTMSLHVWDTSYSYMDSILDVTLMLLVVMLVVVVRRWTATCNTVVTLFS